MPKILKKLALLALSLFILCVVASSTVIAIAALQRNYDTAALQDLVATHSALKGVKSNAVKGIQDVCNLRPEGTGRCPSLLYTISAKECKDILKRLEMKANKCEGTVKHDFKGRKTEIGLGPVYYTQDGQFTDLYLQVTILEANLFSHR